MAVKYNPLRLAVHKVNMLGHVISYSLMAYFINYEHYPLSDSEAYV